MKEKNLAILGVSLAALKVRAGVCENASSFFSANVAD